MLSYKPGQPLAPPTARSRASDKPGALQNREWFLGPCCGLAPRPRGTGPDVTCGVRRWKGSHLRWAGRPPGPWHTAGASCLADGSGWAANTPSKWRKKVREERPDPGNPMYLGAPNPSKWLAKQMLTCPKRIDLSFCCFFLLWPIFSHGPKSLSVYFWDRGN